MSGIDVDTRVVRIGGPFDGTEAIVSSSPVDELEGRLIPANVDQTVFKVKSVDGETLFWYRVGDVDPNDHGRRRAYYDGMNRDYRYW